MQNLVVGTQIYAKDVKLNSKRNQRYLTRLKNSVFKIINVMPLTFVFVYQKNAMFACSIGEHVITEEMFLTLCQGQTLINRKHNIINVDPFLINCTHLCNSYGWRRNTYNVREQQNSVGFGCWNSNICKRRKTEQQEEPAVLDAINTIALLNFNN